MSLNDITLLIALITLIIMAIDAAFENLNLERLAVFMVIVYIIMLIISTTHLIIST